MTSPLLTYLWIKITLSGNAGLRRPQWEAQRLSRFRELAQG